MRLGAKEGIKMLDIEKAIEDADEQCSYAVQDFVSVFAQNVQQGMTHGGSGPTLSFHIGEQQRRDPKFWTTQAESA
jgi:hypothetical protein